MQHLKLRGVHGTKVLEFGERFGLRLFRVETTFELFILMKPEMGMMREWNGNFFFGCQKQIGQSTLERGGKAQKHKQQPR
jgi:hypothetical protein